MSDAYIYVGWMQNMPTNIARFMRKYVIVLVTTVLLIAVVLAANQREFSKANFEFGKTTTIDGVYHSQPVPHLVVRDGQKELMVLLVGYGKHGASGVMKTIADANKLSLEGKRVELKGTLLYGDGKILMQVDGNERPLTKLYKETPVEHAQPFQGEHVTLKGEIIDPKCFFGVMKPGEGKVHKECAIRCIAGGIPPVLKITTPSGLIDYVILVNENGSINKQVLSFIAKPVTIRGSLSRHHNWHILNVQEIK